MSSSTYRCQLVLQNKIHDGELNQLYKATYADTNNVVIKIAKMRNSTHIYNEADLLMVR